MLASKQHSLACCASLAMPAPGGLLMFSPASTQWPADSGAIPPAKSSLSLHYPRLHDAWHQFRAAWSGSAMLEQPANCRHDIRHPALNTWSNTWLLDMGMLPSAGCSWPFSMPSLAKVVGKHCEFHPHYPLVDNPHYPRALGGVGYVDNTWILH